MISPEWDEPPLARARLLEDVLAADDQDAPIPRAAMLVMSALPDLKDVPQPVLARLVGQAAEELRLQPGPVTGGGAARDNPRRVRAAAHGTPGRARGRGHRRGDRRARRRSGLRGGGGGDPVSGVGWFTTEIVDALLREAHRDQARLGWPVRWALLAALGQPAADPSRQAPAPDLDMSRLVTTHLPMRQLWSPART